MATKIQEWIKAGSGAVAIVSAALTLMAWTNQSYLNYLSTHFATKQDIAKLEAKIDTLIEHTEHFNTNRRK
jgi:hypothetical protein